MICKKRDTEQKRVYGESKGRRDGFQTDTEENRPAGKGMERRETTQGMIHSACFQVFKKRFDKYLSQMACVCSSGLASGLGVD